jgi:hypothetical protein
MLPARDAPAPLPVAEGFEGYTELSSAVGERQFQFQSAVTKPRAEGLRLQNGNAWGFVAVGVAEAAGRERVAP